MPPKKTKAQAAGSSQPARQTRSTSREPAPMQPPLQTRGGRKRRHSDASDVSDRPSSSQSATAPASTPSKRRKRGKTTVEVEHEVLAEVPEVIEEDGEDVVVAGAEPDAAESIETSQSSQRHVHFGGSQSQQVDVIDSKSTAQTTTPYPRKMAIKRRVTASPAVDGNHHEEKRKRMSIRRSLPPSLSQLSQESSYVVEDFEFAPLSEVLRERMQQRAAESKDVDMLDEDMLVFAKASQEEVSYPELPTPGRELAVTQTPSRSWRGWFSRKTVDEEVSQAMSQTLSQSRSQRRTTEMAHEDERRQFQDAIIALSKEASDAKAKLQILEIEVQGLGFGQEGLDARAVLVTMREAMLRIREKVESVLPDTIPEGASNEDIIEILAANVKEFADRLRIKDQELQERTSLIAELREQIQGLLDHLADAQVRRQQLEERWNELDAVAEEKNRENEDLQEELRAIEDERNLLQDELHVKTKELEVLRTDNQEFATSVDRLTASLQGYRAEETRLQNLISKMEEEHGSTVEKMNREREETVQDLETRLGEEIMVREGVEQTAEERQVMIIRLQAQIETIEKERDTVREQLVIVTSERDSEQETREIAEAGLEEKNVEVEDLETRVARLEEELASLNDQLQEFRHINETERAQREQAETDLDDRNVEIDDLNLKLREQGKQANELRQKLFEVQQTNERRVKELETQASEREEQYQTDIADEIERRETAEADAQDKSSTIQELEARIDEVEEQMRVLLIERDERIVILQTQATEKDAEIEGLQTDLANAENLYDAEVAKGNEQRQQLQASITSLQITISERETQLASLRQEAVSTAELHDSEMEDRNNRIAELNYQVVELQTKIDELATEKSGLERRVEQEAEQMLEMQNEKSEEIETLKTTILDKQEKMKNIETKAYEADIRWAELLEAREEEIATLRTTEGETTQTVATLTSNLEALRRIFQEYVAMSNGKMAAVQGEAAAKLSRIEEERIELESAGARMMAEVESMEAFSQISVATTTTKTVQRQEQSSAKKTRGRKKRVVDSGIGMDAEAEDDTLIAE